MVKFLIFLYQSEALDFISQINSCLGLPSGGTTTYWGEPVLMCEYDEQTGDKLEIGYGIPIEDLILDCMTEEQISDIIILPNNINACDSFTGTTN